MYLVVRKNSSLYALMNFSRHNNRLYNIPCFKVFMEIKMSVYSVVYIFCLTLFMSSSCGSESPLAAMPMPPHCTTITKETEYTSTFKLEYPVSYIASGQREGYQQMFCVNPPTVQKAHAVVCDWTAPPQAHFTLGDEYLHVVRQDPSGKYIGVAVMTTHQFCGHNMTQMNYCPKAKK